MSCKVQQSVCSDCVTYVKSRIKFNTFNTFNNVTINGKVYCFFEQSGTFKNEFKKLGIDAVDMDIQNNFGQTDHVVDLFAEIEIAYGGGNQRFGIRLLAMI